MENKHKHLELIQSVINRMAQHSFVLKGWSVTLVVAVFALSAENKVGGELLITALLPVAVFWFLDAYYLQRERLFRALSDEVRKKDNSDIDYSMHVEDLKKGRNLLYRAALSWNLIVFYGALTVLIFVINNLMK